MSQHFYPLPEPRQSSPPVKRSHRCARLIAMWPSRQRGQLWLPFTYCKNSFTVRKKKKRSHIIVIAFVPLGFLWLYISTVGGAPVLSMRHKTAQIGNVSLIQSGFAILISEHKSKTKLRLNTHRRLTITLSFLVIFFRIYICLWVNSRIGMNKLCPDLRLTLTLTHFTWTRFKIIFGIMIR